jgi:hypothetical protein
MGIQTATLRGHDDPELAAGTAMQEVLPAEIPALRGLSINSRE